MSSQANSLYTNEYIRHITNQSVIMQADGMTTIRRYLKLHPDIMEEVVPSHLAKRYAG